MSLPKLPGPTWPDETVEGEGVLHRRPDTFGKLFASIIHDTEISDGAARLYAHMHWRYGSNHRMFESIQTMAAALNVSERTIKLRINELAAAGWIVVMARRSEGKVDSNFYHIFELPADSDKFRREYQPVEGEYMRPTPGREKRKSRKGVGGKPAHKAVTEGTQVPMAVGTQVPMVSEGTQVPAAGGTQVPTIKIQTQSIQTQKIVGASAADVAPAVKPGSLLASSGQSEMELKAQSDALIGADPVNRQPKYVRRSEGKPYPVYDALERLVWNTPGDDLTPRQWQAPIGVIAKWLTGEVAKFQKHELGYIETVATPEQVEAFVRWWKRCNPGVSVPRDVVKFVMRWREWRASQNGTRSASGLDIFEVLS